VAATVARGRAFRWLAVMWAGAAITHPFLDMLTDGGTGVMLLFPFSTERLFFPWRPIRVSPLSIARFFDRAGEILWSELPFCVAAVGAGLAARLAVMARDR
jgi:inner membrane protein